MKLEIIGNIPVPKAILREANCSFKRSVDRNVEMTELCGLHGIYAMNYIDWHDDKHVTNYSALLVVKNTLKAWVEAYGEKPVAIQPRGTLMLLTTKFKHRLATKDCRDDVQCKGIWMAVFKDYDKKPSRDEVVADFTRNLNKVRANEKVRKTRLCNA